MKILVTGSCGFIGYYLCLDLLRQGHEVWGIDNLNDYYDWTLKRDREKNLEKFPLFTLCIFDLQEQALVEGILHQGFDYVFHLAAQAGVRYSLVNPQSYIDNNCTAFLSVLNAIRNAWETHPIKRFFYASSSSVYGRNQKLPFNEKDRTDEPANIYAATKKFNELTASSYGHLFGIPSCGLRFFTVYGAWGRPDMALFRFMDMARRKEPVPLYNGGKHLRDWTHVDDVMQGLRILLARESELARDDVFNISSGRQIKLTSFVEVLKEIAGDFETVDAPFQPGDVEATFGDISKIQGLGYMPQVSIEAGIRSFVEWYNNYYRNQ